jgi:hypothetical protein
MVLDGSSLADVTFYLDGAVDPVSSLSNQTINTMNNGDPPTIATRHDRLHKTFSAAWMSWRCGTAACRRTRFKSFITAAWPSFNWEHKP